MKALLPLACILALAACAKNDEPVSTSSSTASAAATKPATAVANSTPPAATPTPTPAPTSSGPLASTVHPALLDPTKLTAKAPALYQAKFTTTKGDFVVDVHRDWAPNAADRFYNLVKSGFFDDTRFFRAVGGFMVQFGISGDPAVASKWQSANIQDDPVKQSNKRASSPSPRPTPPTRARRRSSSTTGTTHASMPRASRPSVRSQGHGHRRLHLRRLRRGPRTRASSSPQGNAYLDSKFPKLDGVKHAGDRGRQDAPRRSGLG